MSIAQKAVHFKVNELLATNPLPSAVSAESDSGLIFPAELVENQRDARSLRIGVEAPCNVASLLW